MVLLPERLRWAHASRGRRMPCAHPEGRAPNLRVFVGQASGERAHPTGTVSAAPRGMNPAMIAVVVVLALLVGAALPVLAQARVSLRALQRTVEETGPRFNR